MLVELAKANDGGSLLRCTRDDGAVTWQRNCSARGAFFAMHDIGHFVVETVLGFHGAIFGLVARGWEIAETTGKTAKGPISDEALATEHLVGLCGMERVNEYAITFAEDAGRKAPPMDFPGKHQDDTLADRAA